MPFKAMDPELAADLIAGYQNELDPEMKGLEAFYRHQVCPKCGKNNFKKVFSRTHVFADPTTAVPRALLECVACTCLFDPHSGLQLTLGNLALVPPDIPLINPNDD